MSFLDRIREANRHEPARYAPFEIAGERLGWVGAAFAGYLGEHGGVFDVSGGRVRLAPHLDRSTTPAEERTEAAARVLESLRDAGRIGGWRDELFPVTRAWGAPPAMLVERAAVPCLGVGGYGVHLNGYVRRSDGPHLWVARRAADKPTWPGLLDQLAAGGQPAHLGLRENMIKECREEAGLVPEIAERAHAASIVSYVFETGAGLRPDVIYCFDLELPDGLEPVNTDGEVASFELWPVERAIDVVRDTRAFKFNCALVLIDFLVRHGLIEADHPDYDTIVHGLRVTAGSPRPTGPG